MTEQPRTEERVPARKAGRALAALLSVLALLLVAPACTAHHGSRALPGPRAATSAAPAKTQAPDTGGALPRSEPERIVIPRIGVDAPLTAVGLDKARHLMPPPLSRPTIAGWYTGAPTPGSQGTAVVVGHVDTEYGPAVFYPLSRVHSGDRVDVQRQDGRTAVFRVDSVHTYAKSSFPTAEVYEPRGRPELRVITCGGSYDRATGYLANVVVFAHLTGVSARP
ncbi:class F sortase [Streptomyces beihaiensis]|uniref:Class F sortase n=1 Tax=Streptomyces beihaiensis TaxID=2984495 RepID=A0ABT3TXU4_9ACTN|nr:class F sortase [Streptomyces beihaiensis]MCX3060793.1 class F sortase [Streptomyces beihaiensis]